MKFAKYNEAYKIAKLYWKDGDGWLSIAGKSYEAQGPSWLEYSAGPRFNLLQPRTEFTFNHYINVKRGMMIRAGNTKYLVVRKYRNKVWAVPASDTCP